MLNIDKIIILNGVIVSYAYKWGQNKSHVAVSYIIHKKRFVCYTQYNEKLLQMFFNKNAKQI